MSKKTSSIKLIEKPFNSKEKVEFESCEIGKELIFLELYLAKKFKDSLHYLPFCILGIRKSKDKNKVRFGLVDYNNGFNCFFTKNKFNFNDYEYYIKKYRDTKKRFTLFSVTQLDSDNDDSAHSIVFLYDKKYNQLELFDSIKQDLYPYKSLIRDFFTAIYGNKIKIVYPYTQEIFGNLQYPKCDVYCSDASGFCAVWSLWYIEYRLTNFSKSRHVVLKNAIKEFKKSDKICRVILGYALFLKNSVKHYTLDVNKFRGVVKIIDTRTNKKYNIPLKMISLLGLAAAIIYMIKKLNFGFKRV